MNTQFKLENTKYHLIFIFILSLNYLFPLIIFKEITLFYHDVLDVGIVYYHVLGKYLSGDTGSIDAFLAGNIKVEYLRHWLKPYTLIYAIFSTQFAYWLTEILIKITAYISFFILAKKISNNFFFSTLSGALYACMNFGYIEGFGTAVFPYLLYLALFKDKLKLKNYFIIIFFGFNADLVRDIFLLPIMLGTVWVVNATISKEKFSSIIKIVFLFFIGMFISSSNLIYAQLFDGPFHREEFFRASVSFKDSLVYFLKNLIALDFSKSWRFFEKLPQFIFLFPLLLISFFQKDTTIKKILIFYFLINFFISFLGLPIINDFKNSSTGILRAFNFHWIKVYLPAISILLFLYNLKKNNNLNKFLISFSLISLVFFQINSSIVPLVKKGIYGEEYRNLYTFSGYYLYDDYKKVKKIVKDKRVLSIGLDPMIAIMNDIKTIDGYHTLYPLKYKLQFRQVIEKELGNNKILKDYYDNWGSRVYAFVENSNNIQIDFQSAKKLGADFIISKYKLNDNNLLSVCDNCSDYFRLYKIN